MVGEAKPSLLEILHSKTFSPLGSLYHKPEEKEMRERQLKMLTDELIQSVIYTVMHAVPTIHRCCPVKNFSTVYKTLMK